MMAPEAVTAVSKVYARAREAQIAASADLLVQPAQTPVAHAEAVAADAWKRCDSISEASPAKPLYACAKGCRWCCHQPVMIGAVEAIAVAGVLRENFGPMGTQRLGAALAQRAKRASGSGWEDAWRKDRVPCAFLGEDGGCTIHAFRPAVCRGYHSLSRQACEAKYIDSAASASPIDSVSHLGANGVLHGMLHASHRRGRDAQAYELHTAILAALADPLASALRWSEGKPPFPEVKARWTAAPPDESGLRFSL